MKRGTAVCLAAVAASGILLTMPAPGRGRGVHSLLDLAHAPAFAGLTWIVLRGGRAWLPRTPWRAGLTAWTLVVLFGGAMELVQGLTGRQPSWRDAGANALGAAAGLLGTAAAARGGPARPWRRAALIGGALALLAVPSAPPLLTLDDVARQGREMPRLASFERAAELARWDFRGCRAGRSGDHATDGAWGLRLDLEPGPFPSAVLDRPPRDWSGRDSLTFDAYLGPGPPLDLVVKVEDERHAPGAEDRFYRVVHLLPGARRVQIALSDVEQGPATRRLDLRRVARLELFAVDLPATRTVYLDDLRLR